MVPGSKVMVGPGGFALIVYARGCVVRVGSGLWVVQDAAPCDKGTTELDFTGRMNEGLLNREPPPPPPRPALDPLIVGGVIVGGAVVACLVWCRGHDHHKPASP